MELVAIAGRPVPEGVRAGLVSTRDGVALRYARWDSLPGPRRGTVLIAQGRAEFIEKYFDVVDRLRARGFGVIVFDWRGQGGSTRAFADVGKGHVRRFDDYDVDLETVMSVVALPDCRPPFYALGHSMGGAILLRAAKAGRTWFDRMVLCAPMLGLSVVPFQQGIRLLTGVMVGLGLGGRYVPGGNGKPLVQRPYEGNLVTSDPDIYARIATYPDHDPRLGLGAPTVQWLHEALSAMAEMMHPLYPVDIRQPILIVAAGADGLVSTPAIEAFGARLKAGRTLVIAGAKHELMMERAIYREPFFAAFDAFVPGEQAYL